VGWPATGCPNSSRCLTVQAGETASVVVSVRSGRASSRGAHYVATQSGRLQYSDKGSMATVSRFFRGGQIGPLGVQRLIAWLICCYPHLVTERVSRPNHHLAVVDGDLPWHSARPLTITGPAAFARMRLERLAELCRLGTGSAQTQGGH